MNTSCAYCSNFQDASHNNHMICARIHYPNGGFNNRNGTYQFMKRALDNLDYDSLKYFLSMGADPNYVPTTTVIPFIPLIHTAFERNNLAFVKLLLHWGAQTNIRDITGRSILHYVHPWMRMSTYFEIIHDKGCPVDTTLIDLVINEGADINAIDNDGNTPLHIELLCIKQTPVLLTYLYSFRDNRVNVNIQNNKKRTILHFVAITNIYRGNNFRDQLIDFAKYLLELGADPNIDDETGRSPKCFATNKMLNCMMLYEKLKVCDTQWLFYGTWEYSIQWLPQEVWDDVTNLCTLSIK